MKIIIITVIVLFTTLIVNAQVLFNNGSTLTLKAGCTLQINGNAQFQNGGTFTNDGNINIIGNITNNQNMSSSNTGALVFNGSAAQTLSGSSTYFAENISVNNSNGIVLNAPLKVNGVFNFNNGIVTVPSATNPVTFTSNASVSVTNIAKDASHINGYLLKEGNGNFTYPIGDGTKYQKIDVNTSSNTSGLRIKYNATDAGSSIFTTGGTEATALVSYNNNEHWDITALSTTTGTVTIFWDGYKDAYPNPPVNQRKVAHLFGGNWLNEGTTGNGTTTVGSVTSNPISNWGLFAMGSITTALPLRWLSVTCNLNNQKQPVLNWSVEEIDVDNYIIEKSSDGISFSNIGNINSKGNGTNNYLFIETSTISGKVFYRIKQLLKDGSVYHSSVIKLSPTNNQFITVFPNPVKDKLSISGATIGCKAIITDLTGKQLQIININQLSFTIDISKYTSGVYILKIDNGVSKKIIKE